MDFEISKPCHSNTCHSTSWVHRVARLGTAKVTATPNSMNTSSLSRVGSILLIGLASFTSTPFAQAQKVAVHIEAVANDVLGRSLLAETRRAVASSETLSLARNLETSDLVARITTMNPQDTSGLPLKTVYALVLNLRTTEKPSREVYGMSYVGQCGAAAVEACATEITSKTEDVLRQLRALPR